MEKAKELESILLDSIATKKKTEEELNIELLSVAKKNLEGTIIEHKDQNYGFAIVSIKEVTRVQYDVFFRYVYVYIVGETILNNVKNVSSPGNLYLRMPCL